MRGPRRALTEQEAFFSLIAAGARHTVAGVRAMDTLPLVVRPGTHPLDPLSPAEISLASAAVRAKHDLGPGMRFETIVLWEPADPANAGDRRAFVAAYDIVNGDLFEAIVSLTNGVVESWVPRPGARPRIAPEEFLLAEQIAKQDPRFFFDRKPTLDVPPARSTHSCCT